MGDGTDNHSYFNSHFPNLRLDALTLIKTPLGVNMNHPFIDDEPIGKTVVYVQFSDKQWLEMGKHRVRLVNDELIGGYNLVEDHEDYKTIGILVIQRKKPN